MDADATGGLTGGSAMGRYFNPDRMANWMGNILQMLE
jgi:hypothetical protein